MTRPPPPRHHPPPTTRLRAGFFSPIAQNIGGDKPSASVTKLGEISGNAMEEAGAVVRLAGRVRCRVFSLAKAWIVRLALWGWLPYGLATWLIQRGGMRHE